MLLTNCKKCYPIWGLAIRSELTLIWSSLSEGLRLIWAAITCASVCVFCNTCIWAVPRQTEFSQFPRNLKGSMVPRFRRIFDEGSGKCLTRLFVWFFNCYKCSSRQPPGAKQDQTQTKQIVSTSSNSPRRVFPCKALASGAEERWSTSFLTPALITLEQHFLLGRWFEKVSVFFIFYFFDL